MGRRDPSSSFSGASSSSMESLVRSTDSESGSETPKPRGSGGEAEVKTPKSSEKGSLKRNFTEGADHNAKLSTSSGSPSPQVGRKPAKSVAHAPYARGSPPPDEGDDSGLSFLDAINDPELLRLRRPEPEAVSTPLRSPGMSVSSRRTPTQEKSPTPIALPKKEIEKPLSLFEALADEELLTLKKKPDEVEAKTSKKKHKSEKPEKEKLSGVGSSERGDTRDISIFEALMDEDLLQQRRRDVDKTEEIPALKRKATVAVSSDLTQPAKLGGFLYRVHKPSAKERPIWVPTWAELRGKSLFYFDGFLGVRFSSLLPSGSGSRVGVECAVGLAEGG